MELTDKYIKIDLLRRTMYRYNEAFISGNSLDEFVSNPVYFFNKDHFVEIKWEDARKNFPTDYDTSVGVQFTVIDINETTGLVLGNGLRIRKDGTPIESFNGSYNCIFENNQWKIKSFSGIRTIFNE